MDLDFSIFNFINGFAGEWRILDWVCVFFAEYLGYFLILAAFFLLIKEKDFQKRIYFFSLATLSIILGRGVIVEIIRFFYHKLRPFLLLEILSLIDHDLTGSFPSGHSAVFFALAFAVFCLNQKTGYWFFAGAFFIGLARIFIGVHWPSDILIGAFIGLASGFLIKKILLKNLKFQRTLL